MRNVLKCFKSCLIRANGKESNLLLILGAQKAGTTFLFRLLNSIPSFCASTKKEIGYFSNDYFYENDKSWYLSSFGKKKGIMFEASPEYLYYPYVPQRIAGFGFPVRFIVLLREPAARCLSAWNMFRKMNRSSSQKIYDNFIQYANKSNREAITELLFAKQYPSFRKTVLEDIERYESKNNNLEPSFVRRGIYCEQIENYLNYFRFSDFLFIEQNELRYPKTLLKKIANFLEMKINAKAINTPEASNVGKYDGDSDDVRETLNILKIFYRPFNEKLFDQIGVRYGWNKQ